MKTNEWRWGWRWARLKKDILIDDTHILRLLAGDSFVLPANTIVWARTRVSYIDMTLDPELLENAQWAFLVASIFVNYNDLLEPLE